MFGTGTYLVQVKVLHIIVLPNSVVVGSFLECFIIHKINPILFLDTVYFFFPSAVALELQVSSPSLR